MSFWNFKKIKNAANGAESVELRIEGDIVDDDSAWIYELFNESSASPNKFKKELSAYAGQDLTVWVDSYGGSVFAAAGIYNSLKEHKGKVTVKIDSKAMSAASVIAMAGDEILISPVAILMIHNPLTVASGDMHDLRKTADILDQVKETIINAYSVRTKKPRKEISVMMDDETWMSANAALKAGFVDGILYANEKDPKAGPMNLAYNKRLVANTSMTEIKKVMDFERSHFDNGSEKETILKELDELDDYISDKNQKENWR